MLNVPVLNYLKMFTICKYLSTVISSW